MGFAITDDLTKKPIPAEKLGPAIVHTIEFTFISAEENAKEKILESLNSGKLTLADATPSSALNELSALAPEPSQPARSTSSTTATGAGSGTAASHAKRKAMWENEVGAVTDISLEGREELNNIIKKLQEKDKDIKPVNGNRVPSEKTMRALLDYFHSESK